MSDGATEKAMPQDTFRICKQSDRWSMYDARGIYCCVVCPRCVEEKRAQFNPDIFKDPNYAASEPIEDE